MSNLVGNPEDRLSHNEAQITFHCEDSYRPMHLLVFVVTWFKIQIKMLKVVLCIEETRKFDSQNETGEVLILSI